MPPDPQSMTGQKVARHRKSVDERIDEIYQCGMAIFAAGFKGQDLHGAAKGLAEARAATALMGKPTEDDDKPGIDRAVEIMKARHAGR